MINFRNLRVLATFYVVLRVFVTEMWCDKYSVSNCSCGLDYSARRGRIYGGKKAKKAEFPWYVALYAKNKYYCGGTLINNLYILTAAHCFRFKSNNEIINVPLDDVSVVLGGYKLDDLRKYVKKRKNLYIRKISYIKIHQYYYYGIPKVNDICLARMSKPITKYSFKILPICLPPIGPTFEGVYATVCGMGAKFKGDKTKNFLRKTIVRVYPNVFCKIMFKGVFYKDAMICAFTPGQSPCQGDSGGPLMIAMNTIKYIQIGIASFGDGCRDDISPTVFTRLNRYVSWIKHHSRDAMYCEH